MAAHPARMPTWPTQATAGVNTGASMAAHPARMSTGPTAGMNTGASMAAHPAHMPTGPTQATAGVNAGVSRAVLGACAQSAVHDTRGITFVVPRSLPTSVHKICDFMYSHKLHKATLRDIHLHFGTETAQRKLYDKMKRILMVTQQMCNRVDGQTDEGFEELVLSKARTFDNANHASRNKRTASEIVDHYNMFNPNAKRRKRKDTVCNRTVRKDEIARICPLRDNTSVTCPFCHSYDENASPPCECKYCDHIRGQNSDTRTQVNV